jgi:hypothetical protein
MEKTEKLKIIKVGDLLKETFSDYRQNWQKFGYLLVIPLVLFYLMTLISYTIEIYQQSLSLWFVVLFGIISIIIFFIFYIFYIFVYIAQFLLIKDLSAEVNFGNLSDWLKKAKPYFWRIIAISIVYALATFFGILLLIIPGVFFMVAYAFTVYAGIIEDINFENSFGYSRKLVKGYWWAVFGRFILGLLLLYLFVGLISLFFIPLKSLFSIFLTDMAAAGLSSLLFSLISIFIGLLVGPLFIIYSYKIYTSLKGVKGL